MKIKTEAGHSRHCESNQNESVTNNPSLIQRYIRGASIFQAFNHRIFSSLTIKRAGYVENDRSKPYFVVEGFKLPKNKEIEKISAYHKLLSIESETFGRDAPSTFLIAMTDKTVYRFHFKNENEEYLSPYSLEVSGFAYDRNNDKLTIYSESLLDYVG